MEVNYNLMLSRATYLQWDVGIFNVHCILIIQRTSIVEVFLVERNTENQNARDELMRDIITKGGH